MLAGPLAARLVENLAEDRTVRRKRLEKVDGVRCDRVHVTVLGHKAVAVVGQLLDEVG